VTPADPDQVRAATRETWETAARGWGKRADRVREWGMPASVAMVEALDLQPGQRVLELAAGPGDTGFMAAELVRPGGTLISSDGAEPMLEVARRRAEEAGVDNVEFRQLELEWIDLETASVDAVLVRWGIMLVVDPEAAAREIRRVLRARGHAAFAVWDARERNPWATIPTNALIALAGDGALVGLLQSAGFIDVDVSAVQLLRRYASVEEMVLESADVSPGFSAAWKTLGEDQRAEVVAHMRRGAAHFTDDDGSVVLPGVSLVARAGA
jgi:SAM-dependent methyltransferase